MSSGNRDQMPLTKGISEEASINRAFGILYIDLGPVQINQISDYRVGELEWRLGGRWRLDRGRNRPCRMVRPASAPSRHLSWPGLSVSSERTPSLAVGRYRPGADCPYRAADFSCRIY